MSQCYRDDPNDNIIEFKSLTFKTNIAGKTSAAYNTKNVEIAMTLKYLSNFWKTFEMPLIIREINLILTCSENCLISFAIIGATKSKRTDRKTLHSRSNFINSRLCKTIATKSGFKIAINWNKYQSKVSVQVPNLHINFLIDPNCQGVNRLCVLLFKNTKDRAVDRILSIKSRNIRLQCYDWTKLFWSTSKKNIYKNIW